MTDYEARAKIAELEAKLHRLEGSFDEQRDRVDRAIGEYEARQRHLLYLVKDEAEDRVIYVGITNDPVSRSKQHTSDPASAVWCYINERGEAYAENILFVDVAVFPTRAEARSAEERLISTLPGLVNRDVDMTKRRVYGRAERTSIPFRVKRATA